MPARDKGDEPGERAEARVARDVHRAGSTLASGGLAESELRTRAGGARKQ